MQRLALAASLSLLVQVVLLQDASASTLQLGKLQLNLLSPTGGKVISTQGTYPGQLLSSPQVSFKHSLEVSFPVTAAGQPAKPQQVFLALQHVTTGTAAYAVGKTGAKAQPEGSYTISAPFSVIASQLGNQAGEYRVVLLVGDAKAAQAIQWELGVVELLLEPGAQPASSPAVRTAQAQPVSNAKPIITHIFRSPEKRPPAVVSLAFTALVLAPLLLVVGYVLLGLQANFKAWPRDAPTSLAALGFHGLLAAVLVVYWLFWTRWNLAQTLPVVLALGAALVLVGHRALSGIAAARHATASKQD